MICRLLLILFIATVFFNSCIHEENTSGFVITGTFTNPETNVVVLEELGVKELTPIDSAIIGQNGEFTIRYTPDDISLYILRIGKSNFITLLIDKGENVEIKADASRMASSYELSGSEGSGLLWNYYKYTAINNHKVDSLGKVFKISRGSTDFANIRMKLDSSYRMIFKDQQKYVMDFISRHPSSLASLLVLNKRFGNGYVLSEKEHFDFFLKIDSGLMASYPGNKHTMDHHARVSEILRKRKERELADEKLQPGMPAPEITVTDTGGTSIPLASTKGYLTLIYFWAGENALCRQINRELTVLYEQYKDKGLKIYAVSFDNNPEFWKAAVKLDGLKWIQVSDRKGYASPIIKLYNLPEELPYFYLIDKESLILQRGNKAEFGNIKEQIKLLTG